MPLKAGINGFGRIGRNVFRAAHERGADIDWVGVNDITDTGTLAHLLKHDSVLGGLKEDVEAGDDSITVDGRKIQVIAERDPKALPWGDLNVDLVVESTGIFTDRDAAAKHLDAGAPRVIVSAPAKGADATFVVGVNDDTFDPEQHKVVSNASCTTNCFVPMVKVLDDAFGIQKGLMTTVHAMTNDQNLLDLPHKDLRRARSAAINVVPSSTGAAKATGLVLEAMNGRLDGFAFRVPVPIGSVTDFTAVLDKDVEIDEVNEAFKKAAAEGPMSGGILVYSEEPLVSTDIIGSSASCTFDSDLTMTMGNMVKVAGWYDNEWGYSNRLVDLVERVGAANK